MLKIFNLYITDFIVFYSNKAFVSIRNFNATYIWPKKNISLLIISCIIEYVTNKRTLKCACITEKMMQGQLTLWLLA